MERDVKTKVKGGEQKNMPYELVQMKRCICLRCDNKWIPRDEEETPVRCPKCKSPYWNRPRKNKGYPIKIPAIKK